MIPWAWLITCAVLFVGMGRLIEWLVSEGDDRRRAFYHLVALSLGYLAFHALML